MTPAGRIGYLVLWVISWTGSGVMGVTVWDLTLTAGAGGHDDAMAPWIALLGLILFIFGWAVLYGLITDGRET